MSGGIYKVSGKKLKLPQAHAGWKFTSRPGGWIVAESPTGERKRFFLHEGRGKLSVALGGKLLFGEVISDRAQGAAGGGGSDADLIAQFPGKVRKILVKAGQAVVEGDPLVLVEAMKMEFAVKAPYSGKVLRLLVEEGQQLSPGTKLVDLATAEANGGG